MSEASVRYDPRERVYFTPDKAVVNIWQRGVPVYGQRLVTRGFLFLMAIAAVGVGLGVVRIFTGRLGAYSGLNDAYPWGIWKTFNVMALTALGSGAMSVGIAAWVLYRKRLHSLMRTAVVTSFLFYAVGLFALLIDAGRPWNFFNLFLPWTWNEASPLWEVALAMPLYVLIFLSFEMAPIVLERLWYTGNKREEGFVERVMPTIRKIYPWMVAGAYVMPMMHQSSLGALMLLSGPKLHPLWNSPALPGFYLVQAGICGMGFVIVAVMGAALIWRRPLDMRVLGELAYLMAWVILLWTLARFVDVAIRGQLAAAFALDRWSWLFLLENALIVAPGILLLSLRIRTIPYYLFWLALVTCLGGLAYRFIPTTIAFQPGSGFRYFPSVAEILITSGLIALAIALFSVMVKMFAILPAPVSSWYAMFEYVKKKIPGFPRDAHGKPIAQD